MARREQKTQGLPGPVELTKTDRRPTREYSERDEPATENGKAIDPHV